MKNFVVEHNVCVNLIYYTSLKPFCSVITHDDNTKSISIFYRIKLIGEKEYYYVRGLANCLALLIELERSSTELLNLFYSTVDSCKSELMLKEDELYWMEVRDANRS